MFLILKIAHLTNMVKKLPGFYMGAGHMSLILANFPSCYVIEVKLLQQTVPTYGVLPNLLLTEEAANERI